jgi:hypothetical protein
MTLSIEVIPSVDFDKLEEVLVLVGGSTAEVSKSAPVVVEEIKK